MKAVGIVAEYNPFHLGHAYQLAKTRQEFPSHGIICVMSGNYVQRGDVAIIQKYARAAMAVRSGADVVFELPAAAALQSAEGFAANAIALLNSTGVVTHLSFGCECGNISLLSDISSALLSSEFSELLKIELSSGGSFPKARQDAVFKLVGPASEILRHPNNTLAIEYLKAIRSASLPIIPYAVPRIGNVHDGMPKEGYASASYIRSLLCSGEFKNAANYLPLSSIKILNYERREGRAPVRISAMEKAVLAKLFTLLPRQLAELTDASEGLHMRLWRAIEKGGGLDDICTRAKTRRYTYSRLRRMLLCAFLDIRLEDTITPPYLRILGFNDQGRRLLREIKKYATLPVLTRPSDFVDLDSFAQGYFDREALSGALYTLCYPDSKNHDRGGDFRFHPAYVQPESAESL